MQAVVVDLRRCAAFLNARLDGSPATPPWLLAPARGGAGSVDSTPTPQARRSQYGQEGAPLPSSAAATPAATVGGPPSFRSPSPARGGTTPAGPHTPLSPPATGNSTPSTPLNQPQARSPYQASAPPSAAHSSRPPLAGGATGAAARAGSVGRAAPGSRTAAAARNPASLPAAGRPSGAATAGRTRDPSPQRRAGGGAAAASPAPAAAPQRAPSPAASRPPATPDGGAMSGAGGSGGGSVHSHLPLAVQRALSAAAALAGDAGGGDPRQQQQQQCQDGAAGDRSPGLPQLPLALRRAMQRYRETVQTRDQLLQHHQQRRGANCTSLADVVESAAASYCTALARQYPTTASGSGGSGPDGSPLAAQLQRMSLGASGTTHGSSQRQHLAALRRKAQVQFAALVAAQTWLIQAASELARTRGAGGGAAAAARRTSQADAVVGLLQELEGLRTQLESTLAELAAAEEQAAAAAARTSRSCSSRAYHGTANGRVGLAGTHAGDGAAAAAAVEAESALGLDEELAEAAALWRNRFLRALLAEAAPQGGGAGRGAASGRAAAVQGVRRPPSQQAQAQAQGQDAAVQGTTLLRMPRPLGVWLPDAMWAHAPAMPTTVDTTAAAPPPPWSVLLPPHAGAPWSAPHGPTAAATRPALAPPPLLCSSPHDAVAHGRAQLQLQATVFQLVLEGVLAAPLLPRQRPPAPPAPPSARGGGSARLQAERAAAIAAAGSLAWERWVAQCRLAHLLLFKGAWNRLCSVVQLEEAEGEEGNGDVGWASGNVG